MGLCRRGGDGVDSSGNFPHGGWLVPHADADMGKTMDEIFSKADAFLLGRNTYDIFAAHWPKVDDPNDPVATKLNTLPKFVASRTTSSFDWHNTSHTENVVQQVPDLKQQFEREIQVHGSSGLAQTLIENNLIDEFRLITFPVLLGEGKRLFGSGTVPTNLSLVKNSVTSTGAIVSFYRPTGALQTGTFAPE
jgi:dihydrofolate reductase